MALELDPAAGLRRLARALRRACRRIGPATIAAGVAGLLSLAASGPAHPRLVWNASASAPIGLYWVDGAVPRVGDMVVAWAPGPARRLAARRHYLPANVPLVKRVAAMAGARICAAGDWIMIDGRRAARRLRRDRAGRRLPAWTGCHALADDELFLLMDDAASFDGRYFRGDACRPCRGPGAIIVGALTRIAIALALALAGGPLFARPPWDDHVAEASARFGVPAAWIRRVIAAESGGRTHIGGRPVTSRAGAMGLMQLMPGTWADLRARLGLGDDPYDSRDNILAGAAYLRLMYDRFGYPGLFAAYNAGPARYARHLGTGAALPAETRAYVARIAGTASLPVAMRDGNEARHAGADDRRRIFFPLSGDLR